MSQNETQDPAELGIRWESEEVSVQYGDHATDRKVVNSASQIAVITDLGKFRATFGDTFILAMSDGTSLRVACQRIGRKFDGKNIEANRAAVLNYIRGLRAKGGTITRRAMPDGTFYHGTDENEYRSQYAMLLVDAGVPAGVATALANKLPW